MANKKSKIEIEIDGDVAGLRKAINTATTQVGRFGRDLKASLVTAGGQQFQSISNGFSMIGVAAAAAAAGGLFLFKEGMSSAIDAANKNQSLNNSFLAIQGSARLAGEELQFVKDEANRLGIEFDGSADSYKNMLAASKGTAAEGETTRKIFSAIAEASSALGMSADDTKGSLLAISQIMSKGKVTAEELRGQLGERLPGAFNLMAQALGVTTQELDEMLQNGEVGIDVLDKFADVIHKKYGSAAKDTDVYQKAMTKLKNEYGFLEKEIGSFVTNNTFVIEALKIAGKEFANLQQHLAGNRDQMVNLVKDGVLLFMDSIVAAGETLRFFYNGWQGLGLVAHGAVVLIVKGMELITTATRNVLKPLDLMLTGLAKIGAIDANPLKNFEEELKGFGKFSLDDFNSMLDKVSDANGKFDQGRAIVEAFRTKIAEIPAQYKLTTEQIKGDTEKVNQEIRRLDDGTFTNRFENDKAASKESAESQKQDVQAVGDAWRQLDDGTYTNRFEEDKAASNASAESQKQDVKEVETAWRQLEDGTFTNRTQEEANAFKAMAESQKQDIKSVGDTHSEFIQQALKNIAFLESEAEKGKLSEAALGKLEVLKERLAEILAESSESQKKGIEEVAGSTGAIGEGFKVSFDEAINDSYQATAKILNDIEKIKKAAASIKYATPTSPKAEGFAVGGNPFFGGLRGYGGGDRRMIMVEDGEHVIRKEAVAKLGHGFFQRFNALNFPRLPKFATGGPVTAGAAAGTGSSSFNITLNYSGSGSRTDAKAMVDLVFAEMQRRYRRASK